MPSPACLNDVLSPVGPHFLNLPRQHHRLGTKCSNAQDSGRHFSFKALCYFYIFLLVEQWIKPGVSCVLHKHFISTELQPQLYHELSSDKEPWKIKAINTFLRLTKLFLLITMKKKKEMNLNLRNQPSGWKQRKLSSPCRDEAKVKYLYFLAKQLYAGFD